jgi:hypothetical protein
MTYGRSVFEEMMAEVKRSFTNKGVQRISPPSAGVWGYPQISFSPKTGGYRGFKKVSKHSLENAIMPP